MKSKQADMVEVNGKLVPRTKVGFRPQEKKVILVKGSGVEKTVVITHDTAYIKDEKTGCHIRMGERKLGKAGKKAAKREKIKIRNEIAVTESCGCIYCDLNVCTPEKHITKE